MYEGTCIRVRQTPNAMIKYSAPRLKERSVSTLLALGVVIRFLAAGVSYYCGGIQRSSLC